MVVNPNDSANFNNVSQEFTTLLVESILKKHGFRKRNVKSLSDEQRQHLKNLIQQLQGQLENLTKPAPVTSEAPNAEKRKRNK